MAGQKLLLPYNFSSYDQKALNFVVNAFANQEDIKITLFHAYTPLPSMEVSDDQVTGRLKDSVSYLTKKISEQETALESIKDELVQRGFAAAGIQCVFKPRKKDVASEIVDLWSAEKFDVIVLNHKPGRVKRFFTASVYHKVIESLKNTTYCIVS
jgi:nucleotide-binding universal stress UspA family protein